MYGFYSFMSQCQTNKPLPYMGCDVCCSFMFCAFYMCNILKYKYLNRLLVLYLYPLVLERGGGVVPISSCHWAGGVYISIHFKWSKKTLFCVFPVCIVLFPLLLVQWTSAYSKFIIDRFYCPTWLQSTYEKSARSQIFFFFFVKHI